MILNCIIELFQKDLKEAEEAQSCYFFNITFLENFESLNVFGG